MSNKSVKKAFPWIMAIIGFLIAFLFFKKDKIEEREEIVYKDNIVYVPEIDTVFQTNTVYEIQKDPYLIRDTVFDTINNYIADNVSKELLAEIAKNHYKVNLYVDSVKIDSIGYLLITDTLQANRIKSRTIDYNISMQPPDLRTSFLSVGGSVAGNKNMMDFGVGGSFTTKNQLTFGYEYFIISNVHSIRVQKSIFNFK